MDANLTKNELISVIIPVYNAENYLKRCLDSIINQTHKNLQIIIIDDGSKDNSQNIIKSFDDERIEYYYQENSGISAVRNKGIELANGKFISFIDSDDWLDKDYYEKMYSTALQYNADIAVSGIIRLHKMHRKCILKYDKETCTDEVIKKFELCDVPEKSYVWNKLYRTDLFKNSSIRFIENKIYEDILFTPQILNESGTLVTVPQTYYYYWRHRKSIVAQKSSKADIDCSYMTEKRDEYLEKNGINIDNLKVFYKKYKIFGLTVFKIKTKGNTKEFRIFNIFKF